MLNTLIRLQGPLRAARHPSLRPEIDKTGPAVPPSPRILLVDDEPHVLKLTARMLSDLGYEVIEAESAEMALEWLATAEPVHLVLTDIAMPGMNGMRLAENLQKLYPGQRIALMSGFIGVIAKVGSRTSPYPVLVKPFTQGQLAQRVREALTVQ